MPITFYPKTGTVLMCDFNTGFIPPEMIKKRPVVIISPWSRRHTQLFTVVPLSGTPPISVHDYHVRLRESPMPEWDNELWAKCDLVTSVCMQRLDRICTGRDQNNKRQYESRLVGPEDLKAIQLAVLHGLGFSALTQHL